MNLETQLKEGERALARIWKVTALRGVIAIAFAVVILVWPSIGLTTLIALVGAFALVTGATTLAGAFDGADAAAATARGSASRAWSASPPASPWSSGRTCRQSRCSTPSRRGRSRSA